jgi:hypothetical protein
VSSPVAAKPRPGLDRYSRQAASSCSVAGVLRKTSTPAAAQQADDGYQGVTAATVCAVTAVGTPIVHVGAVAGAIGSKQSYQGCGQHALMPCMLRILPMMLHPSPCDVLYAWYTVLCTVPV